MSLAVSPLHSILTTDEQDLASFSTLSELTVSQAALLLDVPVGYIDDILEDNLIKHRQEGDLRLVDYDSFFKFKRRYDSRNAALDEIMQWEQEMGLYDMKFDLEEYNATRDAIRKADCRS